METRSGSDRGASYDASTQAPTPEKASLIEDFIDIFYAPSRVFARRERANFWVYLLIITVIGGLFAFASRSVFEQIFDAEFQRGAARAMAANPQITPEMMETQRGISTKIGGFIQYLFPAMVVIIGGLMVWGAARSFGAKISYGQAALIITLAYIPRLLQSLVTTAQVLLTDTASYTSMFALTHSPARFMDPDTPNRALLMFMGRLDLFVLWSTVLIAIGIAVMGRIPRARAAMAAGVVWLVASVLTVLSSGT